ncbi:GPI ethanolamine phosphate transferase 2 [Cyphellophora attinorum]|uniref:GPI ethanolamine phosphate transferase 2 n=1 Tax=Cyphellophora attinorum TaxID=1664694 RepID=A0A0N1H773_9EURO|nr:GPI ethanolamine phosphate transferase 2 [Phialophora attinorum]KPI42222.1 GPI ethanolamine phosphate transferase 2 [Phialophora attinorum]
MPAAQRVASIILANILLVISIAIFAAGFFPYKAFIPGLATWQPDSRRTSSRPPFDKVVFMVVDALRSDFVYSNTSNFHFTQSLIRDGAAIPFTGHASPPTITMPRVKAITTGSVPSFVDLVLNFAESDTTSTLATQDSWLAQLRAKKTGKLVMYGDDTWLRLFPGFFDREDGTTSFFVSDFTEVDNNVTRNVGPELKNSDWSVMTLHYLGLDHIGHKTGPRGPNMPAKQAEMDGIVQEIYEAMKAEKHLNSALLVLLGDHGMNEGGNHGANSAGEVSTALTFISPKFKAVAGSRDCPATARDDFQFYQTVEQSDIAPSLAALMDFPVPKNNLGVIIHRYCSYGKGLKTGSIFSTKMPGKYGTSSEERSLWNPLAAQARAQGTASTRIEDEKAVQNFLYEAQSVLSGTASNYDTTKLLVGSALALLSFVLAGTTFYLSATPPSALTASIFALLTGLYAVTMFASSYVEEEHQFWYWYSGFYILLLFFKASRFTNPLRSASSSSKTPLLQPTLNQKSAKSMSKQRRSLFPSLDPSPRARLALFLLLTSLTKRLRQTGQKHSGSPHDLLTSLLQPNPTLLWILILATYTLYSRRLSSRASVRWLKSTSPTIGAIPVLVVMSTLVFKVAFTAADAPELVDDVIVLKPLLALVRGYPLVKLARLAFVGLAQMLGCAIWYEKPWAGRAELTGFVEALSEIGGLALMMQTRASYLVVYLAWELGVGLLLNMDAQQVHRKEDVNTSKQNSVQQSSPSSTTTSRSLTTPAPVLGPHEITVLSILLQQSSFFALGGTNAISTVDLSNAYNALPATMSPSSAY